MPYIEELFLRLMCCSEQLLYFPFDVLQLLHLERLFLIQVKEIWCSRSSR